MARKVRIGTLMRNHKNVFNLENFLHIFQSDNSRQPLQSNKVQLALTPRNCLTGKKIVRIIAYRYNNIERNRGNERRIEAAYAAQGVSHRP